jgi:TM2 domain-containing membrane protein YozV
MKIQFFYLLFHYCYTANKNYNLKDPELFKDEICSYNGIPNMYPSTTGFNDIVCDCQEEFAHDPNFNKTINGVKVQCSYEKKRRFITLFLSIFLPFGLNYLYLGHFGIFFVVISICFITIFGNCYRFAQTQHNESYFKNKWNIFFSILAIFIITFWIMDIILIWVGIVKDSNNIETVDDLYYLVNLNNNS